MDGLSDRTDAELLRLTASEPEAFATFYRRHVRAVLAYARRRTGSAELALDLTAEVFAAALQSGRRYQPGPDGAAAAWLYGIARHKLADSARRGQIENRARQRLAMQPIELTDAGLAEVEAAASGDPLELLLDGLPGDQRDAVRERVLEERDYQEIAARLRCSEQVVRKRVSRGLTALRARMEGET
jgi:RNA polymerase sigma-70 factor (ECF subfamily)